MATRSFCTPVKVMAWVATIPGAGTACFKKYRYKPTPITAVNSMPMSPKLFMVKLYAHDYFARPQARMVCSFGHLYHSTLMGYQSDIAVVRQPPGTCLP